MLAHVSITPVGTGEKTKELVAKAVAIVAKSGLDYQLTAMGMIIEGDWDDVMTIIRKCHEQVRSLAERVVTSVSIDDRAGLAGRLKNTPLEVEYALGTDLETGDLT